MQRIIGYGMIVIAITCWGLVGPLGRFGVEAGLSPLEVAFWRASIGGLFFVVQGACSGLWRLETRQRVIISAFGIPGIAFLFLSYQIGIQHSGAALSAVLNNTAPIWVALWSYLFFKESMTIIKIGSVLMGIAGAILVSVSGGGLGGEPSLVGIAAGIASGFFYSLHYPFGKKYLTNISPVTLYMHILPVGALFLFPFVTFSPKSLQVWMSLIGLGFLSSWVAYRCFCEALKRLEATRVAIMAPVEPFIAAFFAYMWWGEQFSTLGWIGAGLVVLAVLLSIKRSKAELCKAEFCKAEPKEAAVVKEN